MKTFDPNQAVIPILKAKGGTTISETLGTGFFTRLSGELYVVTAKHVFTDNPLVDDEHYVYVFKSGDEANVWNVDGFHFSENSDVAFFKSTLNEHAVIIPFSENSPPMNRDVFCYEYSQSRIEAKPAGGVHVALEPFTHKGNVMRYHDLDYPSYVNAPCFVVSFPAMRGASGAPVICYTDKKNFYVAGMIVANMGRHLMPAQVERITGPDDYSEERSFYLPLGLAIQSRVIRKALSQVGAVETVA